MDSAFAGVMIFLVLPISFVLFVWWFFTKYPPSKSKTDGSQTNLFNALDKYEKDHKGFVGKLVKYGLIVGMLIALFLRAYSIFEK